MAGVNQLTEVGGKDLNEIRRSVAAAMAQTYMSMSDNQRKNTGLIILTNDLRKQVNSEIQSGLKSAGSIGGDEVEIATLVSRTFTQAEAREIGSYRAGDIVVSPVASAKSEMEANVLYRVSGINPSEQRLTLEGPANKKIFLDLSHGSNDARRLAVFEADKQTFVAGDAVKFKITDREHGIFNSAEGRLQRVGKSDFAVKTNDGTELTIPNDSLAARGLQLAYAATAHDIQGSTVDRVLLGMVSSERLVTQKSFYVSLSRMRDTIHLVTDDAGKLSEKITAQTGERMNALEALALQREAQISDDQKQPISDQQADQKERDIQLGKSAKNPSQKPKETDPKSRGEDEPSKDAQTSMIDRLIATMNQDQKQRDERSR
jgi:hypothetical protein